jgi:hypothetical protein
MLTRHNATIEAIDRDTVAVGGHEIKCKWGIDGATVCRDGLQHLRDSGVANWSDEEMADIAYNAEVRMGEAFERTYRIAYMIETTGDFEVTDEFRAVDDDTANAYAEANCEGEWYVIDDKNCNINAGVDSDTPVRFA